MFALLILTLHAFKMHPTVFLCNCESDNTNSIIHARRASKSYTLHVCSSQTARHYAHFRVLKNAPV